MDATYLDRNSESYSNREQQSYPARVAIMIPCHNEELTIAQVIKNFRSELPNARMYVFDNNSTDGTVAAAQEAGASIALSGGREKVMWCRRCSPTWMLTST